VRSDGRTEIAFVGHIADELPSTSIFSRLEAAAGFFSLGATGYSATRTFGHYHGMELHSLNWTVLPLTIDEAQSCFFDDRGRFPAGSAELDCALLMRGIEHEWHTHRRNRREETALHFLAVENFPGGVEFLCRHGAEVDSVDFSNAMPLLRHGAKATPQGLEK
jgi:hypothetical protein